MKILLIIAAFTGFVSVALGAAGDHLATIIRQPHAFETALRYNQLYSILLVALLLHTLHLPAPLPKPLKTACIAFIAGILIFCGSLYALALTGITALGYLTPAGGILLMAGWLLLVCYGWVISKTRA
jgi:uncharacterized membrane protein YgdD (TMEM256/DUF423 family)